MRQRDTLDPFVGFMAPLRQAESPIRLPLYDPDDPGDGTGGGDQTGGEGQGGDETGETQRTTETPRGAADGAPAGRRAQEDAANRSTGSASRATGTRGDGAMVPSHRLREANARAERLERQLRELQRQSGGPRTPPQDPRRRSTPPTADPETEAIRQSFRQMFPILAAFEERGIDPERLEQLLSENGPIAASETLQRQYWQRVGASNLRAVEKQVQADYGEKASPSTVRHYQNLYIAWLEDDEDRKARYLNGDETLADDFWADVRSDVVEPLRQSATDAVRTRGERVNRLPKFTGRSGPVGTGKKPKAGLTEEQLHDAAFDALTERLG